MNDTIHTTRVITDHAVDPATEKLTITALDAPEHGAGGASHHYEISGMDYADNPLYERGSLINRTATTLFFQNGPIPEIGVNGITHEVLLAIVADRLRGFQAGPYACDDNEHALEAVEEALFFLKERTRNRIKRGVEGTHTA